MTLLASGHVNGLLLLLIALVIPAAVAQASSVDTADALGPIELLPCDKVLLAPGPIKQAFDTNAKYLKSLDDDGLLYVYRLEAAVQYPGQPLGGWEAPTNPNRGSFLGHWLAAAARTCAATGDSELKEKANRIVAELAVCQAANGNGWVHGHPEKWFDIIEGRRAGRPGRPVGSASYYQMHKLLMGLVEVYRVAGNAQALEVACKLADSVERRVADLDEERMQAMLRIEYGGIQEVLLELHAVTDEPRYLALAKRFEKRTFIDPLIAGQDALAGLHGNTHLPQVCAAARRYEVTHEESYRRAVEHFWDLLASTRTYATGGSTSNEHWGAAHQLRDSLGAGTEETCTTYNWLKVTRYLLRWTGAARYGDMYERAMYSGILPCQHPQSGMFIYFLQLQQFGGRKPWGSPREDFWCCYGTGVESFAQLSDVVYLRGRDLAVVNLFIPSEADFGDVRVEQVTDFPRQRGTSLTIHTPAARPLTLAIRIPEWVNAGGFRARVNGTALDVQARPGSYLRIRRTWTDGDRIDVDLPMRLHLAPMNDDPHLAAVMIGPLVLGGLTEVPVRFVGAAAAPEEWMKPVPDQPLSFSAVGTRRSGKPHEVRFVPLDQIVDEKFGVYFPINAPAPDDPEYAALKAQAIDEVFVGDPESEAAHGLEGDRTSSGVGRGQPWRDATDGWFSYRLKVTTPCVVAAQFWGDETGAREFSVLVEGQSVANFKLERNRPGQFFWQEFRIPEELTRDKAEVRVRLEARPGNTAGGLFGLMTVRPPG